MASCRLRTFLILGAAVVWAGAVPAADAPPANLKLVQDHWTAWDPPIPPEGARVHVVAAGDTFWDLAATNLGNPYLWPQLWEKNQYVRDAHWIYPGDPILLDVTVASGSTLASGTGTGGGGTAAATGAGRAGAAGAAAGASSGDEESAAEGDETDEVASGTGATAGRGTGASSGGGDAESDSADGGTAMAGETGAADAAGGATAGSQNPLMAGVGPVGGKVNPPAPLGTQDDIYCSGFIGDVDQEFGYTIIGSEYDVLSPQLLSPVYGKTEGIYGAVDTVKYKLTAGDIVYVSGGRAAGLSPGGIFTALAPRAPVKHPLSHDLLGRRFDYMGRLRILSVQEESAIAEIVQSCDGITVGMLLKPFEPEPIPLARRTPVRPVNDPTTPEALVEAPMIVSSSLDTITLGQDHVVWIDRGEADEVFPGDIFTIYRTNRDALPPVVLGELAVLSVQSHTALAKIIMSRYPVYVGDRLERK